MRRASDAYTPALLALAVLAGAALARAGTVRFHVTGDDGRALPCRIHLADSAGKPQQAKGLPFFRDHFDCPGTAEIELPEGQYAYQVERGPEHGRLAGKFELDGAPETRQIDLRLDRIADLAAEGWYSGDLHVHRPVEDMKLLMQAEDLHVAPVITWWNNRNQWSEHEIPADPLVSFDGNRFYQVMAGEDEREGGALMFFNLRRPLDIAGSAREYPSPMKFVAMARREGAWIDVEKPFWWDVPVWLASGQVDSIGLANNHMCRSRMYEDEAWGRPRDAQRLPPPRGNGFWTQEIYYHLLSCGLRVPPSAGSASGVLPNPLGYDRVYVHVDGPLSYQKWWEGLRAGRSFVTNGPLLCVTAEGHLPGHVFVADEGATVTVDVEARLTGLDNVPAVEIIQDGRVERAVAVEPGSHRIKLGKLEFRRSGWFLVRAITDLEQTFRFASTAPYYVEIGPSKSRISRRSARFFLDWMDERIQRVPLKLDDPKKLEEVLAYHRRARQFWQDRLDHANAE